MSKHKGTFICFLLVIAIITCACLAAAVLVDSINFLPYDDGARELTIVSDLLSRGYQFVLPRDYFAGNFSGRIAILIHDADFSNRGFSRFIEIERELNIRSAFYPRPDDEFFSSEVKNYLQAEAEGWEIGFQYDCLSRADGNRTLALMLFKAQLGYMRSLFNVSTTTYHGDYYNFSISNYDLYDKELWHSLDLNEVYSLSGYSYYSDSDNRLVVPEVLSDLVIVQLHTDWTMDVLGK